MEPSVALAHDMEAGVMKGSVIKDRSSTSREERRAGWFKVKDHSWCEPKARRFDRR